MSQITHSFFLTSLSLLLSFRYSQLVRLRSQNLERKREIAQSKQPVKGCNEGSPSVEDESPR
ncbi:hypothetical protein [Bacillus sp. XF8]|uniref:hypothetical protein n=1 Tax=Bacillus sp. XF8 TaxID=2819289 RepID=UPI001AA03657|nr:hypothetical protein [Bacillus sp. XF8]MBO1580265.1 hypothetical protein [Bacillus sp. XF8]